MDDRTQYSYQDYVKSLFGGDKELIEKYLKSEVSDEDLTGCKDSYISQYEKSHHEKTGKKGFLGKLFGKK